MDNKTVIKKDMARLAKLTYKIAKKHKMHVRTFSVGNNGNVDVSWALYSQDSKLIGCEYYYDEDRSVTNNGR